MFITKLTILNKNLIYPLKKYPTSIFSAFIVIYIRIGNRKRKNWHSMNSSSIQSGLILNKFRICDWHIRILFKIHPPSRILFSNISINNTRIHSQISYFRDKSSPSILLGYIFMYLQFINIYRINFMKIYTTSIHTSLIKRNYWFWYLNLFWIHYNQPSSKLSIIIITN